MKRNFGLCFLTSLLSLTLLSGCSSNSFKITWKNYDGTVLEVDEKVAKGEVPTYDSKTPERIEDESHYYIFKGWDHEVVEAKKNETYTATYDTFDVIDVDPTPDSYIDVLPSNTKEGMILHAFCWTFNDIKDNLASIKEAGFKTIQTSPVQTPKSSGSAWWAYYQPLSFTIAETSPLGTKEELKELCRAAEEYGLSIIVDVVFNHLANIKDGELEEDGTPKVSPEVEKYEPEIYAHRNDAVNPTFHHHKGGSETEYYAYGDLPDLNTGNELVQQRSYDFLKECIDAGVDGFRFDAAKHIETDEDKEGIKSDFWKNTLGKAKTYYKTLTGNDLFAYGEILGGIESSRSATLTSYTKYMDVTETYYCDPVVNGIVTNNGSKIAKANMGKGAENASNLVTWVESHDTFASSKNHYSNSTIEKAWAVIGSRKDTRSLFLARPDDAISVGIINDYEFESENIAVINRFHNRFIGADEQQSFKDQIYINERFSDTDKGAVVVDSEATGHVRVLFNKLGTGIYYDQVTGNSVKVMNGYASFDMDECGIAVLTKTPNKPRPTIIISEREGSFFETMDVTFRAKYGTTCTYQINNNTPVAFTKETKLTFTVADVVNGEVKLTIIASNEQFTTKETFIYKKIELIEGYFNVINFDMSLFATCDLYMWSWKNNELGKWSQNYTIQDGIILIDTTGFAGFLLALFSKGYEIPTMDSWDYDGVLAQTVDISGSLLKKGFFDASGLRA